MKRRIGITKIIGCLSCAFLVLLIIGSFVAPHNMGDTKNYCFSDITELELFEKKLEEENISFSRLSDTTVNISDNEEQADQIYYQIFR